MGGHVARKYLTKKFAGQDLLDHSIFFMGKFLAHDVVDTNHVINDIIKHRKF